MTVVAAQAKATESSSTTCNEERGKGRKEKKKTRRGLADGSCSI